MENLKSNFKLWLEKNEEPIVGEGRIELLSKIEKEGSLNKAAQKLNMSYRHAWGIVKEIEERVGFKIVKSARGGKDGGGTELTDRGEELIKKYNLNEAALNKIVNERTFWENMSNEISARNSLKGKIEEIQKGEVGTKVKVEIEPDELTSFITREAAEELDLEEGDEVEALIKSTEVLISKK